MTEVLFEQKVKIRKAHHCWGCTKEYPVGTFMEKVTSKDGGQLTSVYWCDTCDNFLRTDREAIDNCACGDGFAYGDLKNYENYPKLQKVGN